MSSSASPLGFAVLLSLAALSGVAVQICLAVQSQRRVGGEGTEARRRPGGRPVGRAGAAAAAVLLVQVRVVAGDAGAQRRVAPLRERAAGGTEGVERAGRRVELAAAGPRAAHAVRGAEAVAAVAAPVAAKGGARGAAAGCGGAGARQGGAAFGP